ncbi:uracil-xanthine permease family protein [Pseudohaliea rubra]|uniref:Xanthine permease n=1 Tax=Pseudohaliea rubra DSM 19751 TaxID=1265313 RepID=A0A095VSA4_9GAMM|nr:solute carrier family 23 protein [Pseudohaliea rubra]KGE04332.1 Xanthine permease [Pseudohaliea rubra DSM 19751]
MSVLAAAPLLYGHEARLPLPRALLAGLQHLLAVFGGIVTAPLIMAVGMGLPAAETQAILAASLFVSGIATAIQVAGRHGIGSGLLAIQGTSFTFIGPVLFAFHGLPEAMPARERLAVIFGCCALAAVVTGVLALGVRRLQRLLTPTVTGTTVLLIGFTLVLSTLGNLVRACTAPEAPTAALVLLATGVFALTLWLATRRSPWYRLCSVLGGLVVGAAAAAALGLFGDFAASPGGPFLPRLLPYGVGFDVGVFLLLLPVFLVSATESVGDLTATAALSGLSTRGDGYWLRVRGGILGDALNSLLAALAGTFPNTTFSQNNGVIRLTGIASRRVGYVVAAFLVALGLLPAVAALLQSLPAAVLYGCTLLLFLMVARAGWGLLAGGAIGRRGWAIAMISAVGGWLLAEVTARAGFGGAGALFLQFPVSNGAFLAMALELAVPRTALAGSVHRNPG